MLWQNHKGGWYGPPWCGRGGGARGKGEVFRFVAGFCSFGAIAASRATLVVLFNIKPVAGWLCGCKVQIILSWRLGGRYGSWTATSSITVWQLPLCAMTTPQRWMIRPTYIANECIMTMWRFARGRRCALFFFLLESYVGTAWVLSIFIYAVKADERYRVILWTPLMWRFAGGGAAPSPRAPLPPFYIWKPRPRLVTTPERWMIRPTYIANECVMIIMIMWPKAFPGGGQTCGSCWVTLVIVENTKHIKRTNQATEQPSNWPAN